ncbi:MAG: Crp/Fnr family transcriptional regulator [Cytophagales bacterium]|nr:MAG: Crp/Fnr family transcriptional regulator [Cytophagales bacterium]
MLKTLFPNMQAALLQEIEAYGIEKKVDRQTEILREGQYVKYIPLVIEGLVKVFTRHEEKELLLYYIRPQESCIMSFAALLKDEPSRIFAICEEPTTLLLLPQVQVISWSKRFPELNFLFFEQYSMRYGDLLHTINQVIFDKMDKRLYDYLKEKVSLTQKNPIKMAHKDIANDLGTAREVVSRVMKKLENEGKVRQRGSEIEVL